jgi:DNA-binding IclR family transcriptional regulator
MIDVRSSPLPNITAMPAARDPHVRTRILAEFQEMPAMRLTLPQAARLFSLEPAHCARVLQSLVETGELWTNGRDYFRGAAVAS